MDFSFDSIDFNSLNDTDNDNYLETSNIKKKDVFDETTVETYRIKRLYKIDPILDTEIPKELMFEFKFKWNPYNGIRDGLDTVGPLCFNALNLYDYYFTNRYKGLWTPPQDGYQGMYGDMVGCGKNCCVKSRGQYPEKYLFRLPIIDCYLPPSHKLSIITMGPELTEDEINQIDSIVLKFHPKKSNSKFTSLKKLKYYYDCALEMFPDQTSKDIDEIKSKYTNLSPNEINQKYNRIYVDKLVNLKY